jgi:hypothetical protein
LGKIASELQGLRVQLGKGCGNILIDECGVLTMALSQCGHAFVKKHWMPRVDFAQQ